SSASRSATRKLSMNDAVPGAILPLSAGIGLQMVMPGLLPGPPHSNTTPPHGVTSSPRCTRYHSASAFGSRALKNTPPSPVTRCMPILPVGRTPDDSAGPGIARGQPGAPPASRRPSHTAPRPPPRSIQSSPLTPPRPPAPTRPRIRCPRARRRRQAVRLRLVAHRGRRRVPLHRLDPAVARIRGVVLLAGADDLVVAGPQVEHVLPARRLLPLVAGVVRRAPADRLDADRAARLVLVALAGEDHLPIAGAQPEPEFPRLVLEDLELACHACPPVGSLGTGRAQRLPGTPAA